VLSAVLAHQAADPTEHVGNIRIREAEPQEQERLRDQVAAELHRKKRARLRVAFVVRLGQDGVIRMIDVTVHLIDDDIAPGPGVGEIGLGHLPIEALAGLIERLLEQLIVVGGPDTRDRQLRDQPMFLHELGVPCELLKQLAVEPDAGTRVIDVVLGDADQIGLLVDVEVELQGDLP
jgi:hypothetical protein